MVLKIRFQSGVMYMPAGNEHDSDQDRHTCQSLSKLLALAHKRQTVLTALLSPSNDAFQPCLYCVYDLGLSTVLTQDHYHSDFLVLKEQVRPTFLTVMMCAIPWANGGCWHFASFDEQQLVAFLNSYTLQHTQHKY